MWVHVLSESKVGTHVKEGKFDARSDSGFGYKCSGLRVSRSGQWRERKLKSMEAISSSFPNKKSINDLVHGLIWNEPGKIGVKLGRQSPRTHGDFDR
jgi:hypothetical protein